MVVVTWQPLSSGCQCNNSKDRDSSGMVMEAIDQPIVLGVLRYLRRSLRGRRMRRLQVRHHLLGNATLGLKLWPVNLAIVL